MTTGTYKDHAYAQLVQWVNGKSVHSTANDECTPDFSCCVPSLFERSKRARIEQANKWCSANGFKLFPQVKPPIPGVN